jgi:tape measure domain-containing protein
MAMTLDTAIKFTAKLEGTGLDQLKRGLQGLAQQSNRTSKDLDQLYAANKKLSAASGLSVNSLQRQITVMTNLRNEAQIGSRQFRFYTAELEKLQRQQTRLNGAGSGQGGLLASIGGLRGGLAGAAALAGTLGATQVVGGIAKAGMEAETARVRLKALTDTYGEYNQAQQITARIAGTLRLSNTEATDSFAKLYAGLRPTGVGLKELEQIFVGFNVAARTSGATAQETSNAMIQLRQALVSGRAQGDELRSILEQAPALGQAVAEQMTKLGTFGKVTRAQLKDLGAEGKISTDVLIAALKQLGETELPKLNKMFDTGQQALTDLSNATNKLQVAISDAFGPIALGIVQAFTKVVNGAADAMERFNKYRLERGQEIATNEQAFKGAAKKFYGSENTGGLISFLNPDFRKAYDDELKRLQQQQAAQAPQTGVTAAQLKAQQDAERERQAAREASAMDKAKKNLADQLKIREDMEKRLADFREQSIQRAADLERQLGDQRLDLERSTAEARRRIAAQEQDAAFERERQRLRGAGLGTDALDTQARLNEATRRFTEQKIQIEQNATDRKVQLERTIEDYKITVARGISEILQDAADKMAQKMVAGAREAAGELGGGTASPGSVGRGQLGVGNLVALARSAGFRGQDAAVMAAIAMAESGGRSSAYNGNAATGDKSYGLWQINMLGGMGPQRRRAFGIGNNEALFDPATNANAARQVFGSQGFGAWSVYRSGAYKDFLPAAMAASRNGSARMLVGAPAGNTATPGLPGVAAAGRSLNAAIGANRGAGTTAALGDLIASRQSELGNITSELDSQRKSTSDQLRDYQQILDLQRSGMSPEIAKQRVDAENAAVAEAVKLNTLRDQLVQDREIAGLTDKQKATIDEMITSIDARNAAQMQTINGLTAEQQQLERLKLAYEEKKQLVQGIANSIGNGIGSAIDLLIDGTDNWGDSLRSIAAGVLKDIARQIAQTMVIAPIVKGITSAFGFADGGIMTSDGPLPLRKYAAGGIANSPQLAMFGEGSMPEAYVPLPDGRRIPVAMKGGGGGTNVVVNVDATGSQVQGDAGRGEQLGRAISQAVQAELVKQKRPGGLLAA